MTDTFLDKTRKRHEAKKLGQKVEHCTFDKDGKLKITEEVLDQTKKPRLTMRYMLPVGRKRGVSKPE